MSESTISILPEGEEEAMTPIVVTPAPPVQRSVGVLDMSPDMFRSGLDRRSENRNTLMKWVKGALVEGTDFGSIKIGGKMSKPSLWKPGAEKICGMLGLIVHFPTFSEYEKAALSGVKLVDIIMRCEIRDPNGNVVADGIGARNVGKDQGDLNKALKMACKSAHIAACLNCAGLSEIFTQDLEDMHPHHAPQQAPASPQPVPKHAPDSKTQCRGFYAKWSKTVEFTDDISSGIDNLETLPLDKHRELYKAMVEIVTAHTAKQKAGA